MAARENKESISGELTVYLMEGKSSQSVHSMECLMKFRSMDGSLSHIA